MKQLFLFLFFSYCLLAASVHATLDGPLYDAVGGQNKAEVAVLPVQVELDSAPRALHQQLAYEVGQLRLGEAVDLEVEMLSRCDGWRANRRRWSSVASP